MLKLTLTSSVHLSPLFFLWGPSLAFLFHLSPIPEYLSSLSFSLCLRISPLHFSHLCLCPPFYLHPCLCLSFSQGPAGLPGMPGIDGIRGLPGTVIMMPVRGR